jgi:hypothetical protein
MFRLEAPFEREIEEEWEEEQRLAERTPPAPFMARLKALKRRHANSALS